MAEFKITRFRYTWRNTWSSSSVTYFKDDVVYHRGSAWVCIRQHVSSTFNSAQTYVEGGETNASPAWVKMVEGRQFLGAWTAGVTYEPNTLVRAGGHVYLCTASHIASTNFNSNLASWDLFATGSNFTNNWTVATRYRVGDVVRYNGYTYQCALEHTSGALAEGIGIGNDDGIDDSTAETWSTVVENYSYVGVYTTSTIYRLNDLVKYGGSVLKCVMEHTSSSVQGVIANNNFVTYLPGFEYDSQWNAASYYAVGDVVSLGGTVYAAATNNINSQPGVSLQQDSINATWTVVAKGANFLGEYDPQSGAYYLEGDVLRRGGALWVSLANQYTDDSSLQPFDTSNWQLVIAAQNFTGSWRDNRDYNLYDVVNYRGNSYYASVPHISSFENFPGDNGSGFAYWTVLLIGDQDAVLTILGDMLTYNLKRDVLQDGSTAFTLGDGSTVGSAPIPIGSNDQVLIVQDNQGTIGYAAWGQNPRIYYVSMTGVDDDSAYRGSSYFKPWRTVRYALSQVDDGYAGGQTAIMVSTGQYEEILPLIVPAGTAVVGEELRSTSIVAGSAIARYAADAAFAIPTFNYIGGIIGNIARAITVNPLPGNTVPQILTIAGSVSPGAAEASVVQSLWGNIVTMIDYWVNDTGSPPAVFGSNTLSTSGLKLSAADFLSANRDFITNQALSYVQSNYPAYAVDELLYQDHMIRFIAAIDYDLRFPGNYKSVLAGRFYANCAIGSSHEDMFYVRDTTGIRNMTLKGLAGTLPALTQGQVYRIPTGGAFVSLDPGWGPADTRVWVTNRSCYVQNVTTFGTAAIGQKVDGALHNGGNRSITSNDFTQVISDGIGAWLTNGGRAELVSVFSYYAHIGMFAQNGGTIRATNGNSSYGDFGAVADGIDTNETVRYGYVNTRLEQAVVAAAYAGEILDYILGVEFAHCGQNYTQASYSIVSSGSGAVAIQEEFRDNSMFECQVLNGGTGFTQRGNQAQIGDTLSIILATAENATAAQILGMRILIVSGEGTGQYGYIQAYNISTKNVTVYRESDDLPGWDHVLPGTLPAGLLTTGTRYRIEPRPIFSAPYYAATSITLSTEGVGWAAAVYGETSETFVNVTGSSGTGTTVEITAAPALFTVVKTGRTYTVTQTSGGAGYAVDNVITILGSAVGGQNQEHDIVLQVTDVSDDSTNSVLAYAIADTSLVAASGRFVLTPLAGHFGRYSSDGDTWTSFDLPVDGNWTGVAAGDNKFVAVARGSDNAASSTNGTVWTARTLPSSRNWNSVAYGKLSGVDTGLFVAVADNQNSAAYSTNGTTWTASALPAFGDSTFNQWIDIAFGYGVFVAIANSGNVAAVGTWNGTALTWQGVIMDAVVDSSARDWISVAYGNRRFVAISTTGDVAYSFDGIDWLPAVMPSQDGSTAHYWRRMRYGQGVFLAVGDTASRQIGNDPTDEESNYAATSYDGIVWTNRTLADAALWNVVAFGNPDVTLGDSTQSNSRPTWVAAPRSASVTVNKIYAGARALGRVVLGGVTVGSIKIWEPGSGYNADPTVTIVDPNKTVDPIFRPRLEDGALAQPTFISKGTAYKTSTTRITVTGNGFADKTPVGKLITLDGLTVVPGPGAQFYIAGSTSFRIAVLVGINQVDLPDGTIRSTFQITPSSTLLQGLEHDMEVVIRERYSQVRITGHDFLDIGTGNFEETNYPVLYTNYDFVPEPFQEVQNLNGGRVFYTSTDQDGNFRAGEQFAVEQSTGVITISAEFFDLTGLTELRLSGINVGSTAVIREFSKDGLFTQNSNNIIPTQRAVRAYLASRLNVGGEDLLTPAITAGLVKIGPGEITSTAGLGIDIPVVANFAGNQAGLGEGYVGQTMFFRSFRNT